MLPGLRYGQSCDILFDVRMIIKPNSKLSIAMSTVHKGALQFPLVKDLEIKKCHVNENLDHVLRFKTIDLFMKILAEFKKDGVDGLKQETIKFVEYL